MKDNELLMIILAFFLGFCFRKMMGGDSLIDGDRRHAKDHAKDHAKQRPITTPEFHYNAADFVLK